VTDRVLVHDHPEFDALLSIVSQRWGVAAALVEKDYWVTHTLWALEEAGLQIHFKGGTSLSKGFGLIERFSEDLDVKIEAPGLPRVRSWRSEGVRASEEREGFFRALGGRLHVPGADVSELSELRDRSWRNAVFAVRYPSRASDALPEGVRPFVQLEVGSARVIPAEDRAISSWVHDHLTEELSEVAAGLTDNRPTAIHCVRPEVTLLEKVEAISRRYVRDPFDPASFVRHYEDATRILASDALLPEGELRRLLDEMRDGGDIRQWPTADDPSLNPSANRERWAELEAAWTAIGPIFWGERITLRDCAREIRGLLQVLAK
jgi:hypothetical protein